MKTFPWTRWGVVVGVASAAIGLFAACQSQQPTQQVTQNGSGAAVIGGAGDITVKIEQGDDALRSAGAAAGGDDAKFKDELKKAPGANQAPVGEGPWAFAVVDTGTDGLLARTTNVAQGSPVGHAANRALIWVECIATTDFTPTTVTGDNNIGPKWGKIRWRHLALPTDRGVSDPNLGQTAWMYQGGLAPVGHNGQVKACVS